MMERLGLNLPMALHHHGPRALATWARHLGQGSYFFAAEHEEEAAYASQLHIAAQLADLYDLMATARWGKDAWKIKYPRPWNQERMRIGKRKDAIPIADFDSWYYGGE